MTRAKWAMVIVAVCLVVTAVAIAYAAGKSAVPVQEVVRAQKFELVDAKGKLRGVLSVLSDGSPQLALFDAKGRPRAGLVVLSDRLPALLLGDEKGYRARLMLDADGSPGLVLSDEQGNTRAVVGVTNLETARTGATQKTAESSLMLFDKEGKVLWQEP